MLGLSDFKDLIVEIISIILSTELLDSGTAALMLLSNSDSTRNLLSVLSPKPLIFLLSSSVIKGIKG